LPVKHGESRFSHADKILRGAPIGLGKDTNAKSLFFENAGDDGPSETGMVHIGIAGNKEEIQSIPSTGIHVTP
jgi:hypothetical protein